LVSKLKAQGKELNDEIAAKKKQMRKVSNAIAAAIKRAQDEARREAIAKAKLEKAKRDVETKNNTAENKSTVAANPAKSTAAKATKAPPTSVLLASDADVKLNAGFESNRGSLPWPVEKGYVIMRFGPKRMEDVGINIDNPGITVGSDVGASVKALFDGEVSSVTNIDDMQVVILKHGRYFTTYSNLSGVNLSRGQNVRTGRLSAEWLPNDEGVVLLTLLSVMKKEISIRKAG
jgi:septal ring factor EnvC (AmiA/AmiB activator)